VKPTPKIIPDHLTLFINEVSATYDYKVSENKFRVPYKNYVRSNCMYILYSLSGVPIDKVAALFNISRESIYYNCRLAKLHPETYQNILSIWINTCKRFIKINPPQ
jgi:hypothetical protein